MKFRKENEMSISDRVKLSEMMRSRGRGVISNLYRMFYLQGPGAGTFLGLPFDQLVEHGPGHEFKWEYCAKPKSVIDLVDRGVEYFSALVLSIGQAQKYQHDIDHAVPLIVKLDGHFYTGKVNQSNYPRPTMFGSVEDALKLGAAAVGLSFYLGSEQTGEDIERIAFIREEAHNNGLPLVLWSYPRGPVFDAIQADSLLCCHYAVSAAESLGADVVKTKFPNVVKPKCRYAYAKFIKDEYSKKIPEAVRYLELEPDEKKLLDYEKGMKEKKKKPNYDSLLDRARHIERARIVVGAGTRTFVIFSGGPRIAGDAKAALVKNTEIVMEADAEGRIIGRNFWGVPVEEGLEYAKAVAKVMQKDSYKRW